MNRFLFDMALAAFCDGEHELAQTLVRQALRRARLLNLENAGR